MIVGPPGAGKSTYCRALKPFLEEMGRKVTLVNLDPANETAECDIDVRTLVALDEVMERMNLGPNGALLFCMEYLQNNIDWLTTALAARPGHYLLFDMPGQVELFTSHESVRFIVTTLQKMPMQLCVVNLVDSHYCSDASKFIAVALMSLSCMVQLEMPHVNALAKVDLLESMGPVRHPLEFYTDITELPMLADELNRAAPRFTKLNAALCELVEDYGLVKVCV